MVPLTDQLDAASSRIRREIYVGHYRARALIEMEMGNGNY